MGLEQTDGRGRGGLIDQSGIMLREGGAHLARLPCRRLKPFTAGGLEAAEKLPHLFAIPVRRTGSGGGREKKGEQKQKSSFHRQVYHCPRYRSVEHTSELQSLIRPSYDGFG